MDNFDIEKDKEKVIKEAKLYLSGKSLRQIGEEFGESFVTVRRNLQVKLRTYEPSLYDQVLAKFDENKPDSISKSTVAERVLDAYKLCVVENKTIKEIALELGASEMTIYRDLTRRIRDYHKLKPDVITDEMLDNLKQTLNNHSMNNSPKLRLNILNDMYPTREKLLKFMCKCALQFGMRLELLSSILQEDSDTLYKELQRTETVSKASLDFLFKHGFVLQEEAKANFLDFFNRLSTSFYANNLDECREILREIGDIDAINVRKNKLKGKPVSTNDVLVILKYQLKYGLTNTDIANIFNIDRNYYARRVVALEEKYPKLVSYYYYVTDYYKNASLGER